jgi:F420-0:gamma-glutamyl ligase
MIVSSAGIDESNAGDYFVLLPKDPMEFAKKMWNYLNQSHGTKEFGVVITDSHSVPMRRGAMGVSIGWYGFNPIHDYRGEKDLFGRTFKTSTVNLPDSLAAVATLEMGEGKEQTPIVVIEEINGISFIQSDYKPASELDNFFIDPEDDMFRPLFSYPPWEKGESGKGSKKP